MSTQQLIQPLTALERLDIAAFKSCVEASYSWLEQSFEKAAIDVLIQGRAQFVDALLQRSWTLAGLAEQPIALVAVGGYGRGHLQPYSDIDLLVLCERPPKGELEQQLSLWLTFLWDIGLDIGHSVRTVKDCLKQAKGDVSIATNLLEARHLCGQQSLFAQLIDKLHQKGWSSKAFFLAKFEEQQERHAKFNGTAYNLEPNVKENPGCLRDIQTIGWVAKQHFKVLKGRELVEHEYFTEPELEELLECRRALWRIRCALHLQAGRNENRLLFDHQPAVATRLGYGDEGKASVETMMKAFYRTVRRVSELNEMLLQHFRQDILALKVSNKTPVNEDFALWDGLIVAKHEQVFSSPVQILRFFLLIAERPDIIGMHSATLRLLRNGRRRLNHIYFCEVAECRQVFMLLMRHPRFFGLAWDLMYKHGIMQAYLPQWDHIVGMMQFDLFHAYTVDEHTHRLLKNLYHYTLPENTDFPRCGRIMSNLDKPELLFIAGIFHDIAKGRGGDHSKLGAADVAAFCASHEMDSAQAELITWLVEQHLLMSTVAQRRDIYDPDVISEFAAKVRNKNQLNHLYALTLADIRATNNNLWNDWKASLLRDLYLMTRKALEDGLESEIDLQALIDSHQQGALALLQQKGQDAETVLHFWQRFDEHYFVRFKPPQLAWHAQVILKANEQDSELLVVDFSNDTAKAGTELLIYGKDRPSLFAQVASVLDSRNCSIRDANILSTQDGYVFDTFIVLEQDGERISSPSRISSLRSAIIEQLHKPGIEHTNKRKMPRQLRHLNVPTKVRFFTNQANMTLLELEALDAPGLLATISRQFVALDINLHMAKIATIGERAEDLFILTNADGEALQQSQEVALKQRLIDSLSSYEQNGEACPS